MLLNLDWLFYESSVGNSQSSQASGAYIFRPENDTAVSNYLHSHQTIVHIFKFLILYMFLDQLVYVVYHIL